MKKKLKTIGLVFGGISNEHNVSIESAKTIASALRGLSNQKEFNVISTYIDQRGKWWTGDIAEKVLNHGISKELEKFLKNNNNEKIAHFPENIENIDIWFPVLHGPNGEDGTIQGFFKLTGKPFVGSGVLGSAMAMDKIVMKTIFKAAGLPQAPYITVAKDDLLEKATFSSVIKKIENFLGFPCFIKPANLGSSVGITKAYSIEEAYKGLFLAASFDKRIVIEKSISGRELECGVLGKEKMSTSTVGEVSFDSDWYDYETKYSDSNSKIVIPAAIPKETIKKVQELSVRACKAISAEGLSRVDFFFDEKKNQLWINEINTLPGFTKQSMFPLLWEASGINLDELVKLLVETAKE